ncbi:ABC transporter ATP-binding protein [bacterium SCSIO 12741]|nr:ABC transporter ATP-binding protein [bacterium SCSIO 12741]
MSKNQQREEYLRFVSSENLSLATRRAMDLTVDMDELASFRDEVTEVRAHYNQLRGLGEGELSGEQKNQVIQGLSAFTAAVEKMKLDDPSETTSPAKTVVEIRDLQKHYRNGGHNFDLGPINLSLKSGEICGVVGENGNGKTTLLRILARETAPDTGDIDYQGIGLNNLPDYERKQRIAFIPQRLKRWNGTLLQNLHFAAAIHGVTGEENEERVRFVVHRLGLTRFQHLTWSQLSSGYKLRFELARMIVWRPQFLVLDEPIANLDLVAQQQFLQDLSHLASSTRYPLGIILSSQQLHQIESVADQIVFLKNGKALYSGQSGSFGDDREHNTYQLSGPFSFIDLQNAMQSASGVKVLDNGTSFTLETPIEWTTQKLLLHLVEQSIEVEYFRNISRSTRKLFSDTL